MQARSFGFVTPTLWQQSHISIDLEPEENREIEAQYRSTVDKITLFATIIFQPSHSRKDYYTNW